MGAISAMGWRGAVLGVVSASLLAWPVMGEENPQAIPDFSGNRFFNTLGTPATAKD